MKFIKIATISFLAGNAVDAATASFSEEQCDKAGMDLYSCVTKVITEKAKAAEWKNLEVEGRACYQAAGDDEAAQKACWDPLAEFLTEVCPSDYGAFEEACLPTSIDFEDFVVDLADELDFENFAEEIAEEISEELEDAAFWEEEEDEFITTTKKPKVSKECKKQAKEMKTCITDKIEEGTKKANKWARALGKARTNAEECVDEEEDDEAKLKCYSRLFKLAGKYCPMDDLKEACDITSFEVVDFALDLAEEISEELESTAYALRGSTIKEE